MEDDFSTDLQGGDGSGGNVSDGERQMKLHLLACLCGWVPNRPWTSTPGLEYSQ